MKPLPANAGAPHSSGDRAHTDLWKAPWLLSPYPSAEWLVADTLDRSRTAKINFRFPMHDGRCLTEVPRLYDTVKEYARWIRDPRFSRIDDSQTHAVMVRNMMHIAHALCVDGIASFSHLQPYDIDCLVAKLQKGIVGALSALERLERFVQDLSDDDPGSDKPFGGLEGYVIHSPKKNTNTLNQAKLLRDCNLPVILASRPAVGALLRRIAKDHKMDFKDLASDEHADPQLDKPITTQALGRYLDTLEQLYAMRRHVLADAITIKPFALGAAKVASVKGAETARTDTPPPRLALHLLERSARIVLEADLNGSEFHSDTGDTLNTAAACWVLIAAFSARRDDEIDNLKADCVSGNDNDGWFLRSFIGKTLQREEFIPVPFLVAKAVQVMSAVSKHARLQTGSERLFQCMDANGRVIALDIGRHLDKFAKAVDIPPLSERNGSRIFWHWHPHQFRRFFAILYFYRFEDASIEALSHHLRHFNIEMTRRYVTMDPEVAALWTDVEWGYMGHVARQIATGERSVFGAAGSKLKRTAMRLMDTFRRRLTVVAPERVGAALTSIMLRKGLVLTPKPWVTCGCPLTHDAALVAACRRNEQVAVGVFGPNFANAGPTVCARCPHAIGDGAKRSYVEEEAAYLEAAAAYEPPLASLFRAQQKARLVEIKAALSSNYQ